MKLPLNDRNVLKTLFNDLKEQKEMKEIVKIISLLLDENQSKYAISEALNLLKLFCASAKCGAEALNLLGQCYSMGLGGGSSVAAIELYRKAIEQENLNAMWSLGKAYLHGAGIEKDQVAGVALFKRAADKDHPPSLNYLGFCYKHGLGVSQDKNLAFNFYSRGAKLADFHAENNVGLCYEQGFGTSVNFKKAFLFYNRSAKKGYATAQMNLGLCYKDGIGCEKDLKKAYETIKLSADQEYEGGLLHLGDCYLDGIGIPVDKHIAFKYYQKAEVISKDIKDNPNNSYYFVIQSKLGMCYRYGCGTEDNIDQAVLCFQSAVKGSSKEDDILIVKVELGLCHELGLGVTQNLDMARQLYQDAANGNDARGQYLLARLYEKGGNGISSNHKLAFEWYEKSANNGYQDAISARVRMVLSQPQSKLSDTGSAQFTVTMNIQVENYVLELMKDLGLEEDKNIRNQEKYSITPRQVIVMLLSKLSPTFNQNNNLIVTMPESFSTGEMLPSKFQFSRNELSHFIFRAFNVKIEDYDENYLLTLLVQSSKQYQKMQQIKAKRQKQLELSSNDSLNELGSALNNIQTKFHNYLHDEINLNFKMKEVNDCFADIVRMLKESNERMLNTILKSPRQEEAKPSVLKKNVVHYQMAEELLRNITNTLKRINDIASQFTFAYHLDSKRQLALVRSGDDEEPRQFLEALTQFFNHCKNEVKVFLKFYEGMHERLKSIQDQLRKEQNMVGKRIIPPVKSKEEIDASFGSIERLMVYLESLRSDANRMEQETSDKSSALLKEKEILKKQKNPDQKQHGSGKDDKNKGNEKCEVSEKRTESAKRKKHGKTTQSNLEDSQQKNVTFEKGDKKVNLENKYRQESSEIALIPTEPAMFASDQLIPLDKDNTATRYFHGQSDLVEKLKIQAIKDGDTKACHDTLSVDSSHGIVAPLFKARQHGLGALRELPQKMKARDQILKLRTILENICYEDKPKMFLEATIISNAILGLCARAMECLKEVRGYGSIFQDMARNFRNVIFHCLDERVISKVSDDIKSNQEWLRRLREMAVNLLAYLSNLDLNKGHLLTLDMIIGAVGSKLFSDIVHCPVRKPNLADCLEQLQQGKDELELYSSELSSGELNCELKQLLPTALGFTQARIGSYASYMKWHGPESWRIMFNQLNDKKLFENQIKKGIQFRHVLK